MWGSRSAWTAVVVVTLLGAGCVAAGNKTASRAAPTPSTADVGKAPLEQAPRASQGDLQLTSGQQPLPPPAHRRSGRDGFAGHEFLPPPETPAAPPAIGERPPIAQGRPLTLQHLESLACQNNPTLQQAQRQVDGELAKAIQAGLWPNPRLNYVHEQIGAEGTVGEFVGSTVSQRFVTANKLGLSREKFLARTRAAEWKALEQQYRVLNDVRSHYFRARGHYELVQIHRDLLKSADDEVLTAREQYNVGQATRAQVHLANVALQRARLDLLRSENDYRQSFEALTALVGVDLPPAPLATPLEGDLTPVDYRLALARIATEAPQIQAARSKLESDRIKVRREMMEPVPDILVEGGAGYNFEANDTVAAARVGVEVPLFDRNQGTIRQAQADYARQQAEIRRIEQSLRRELSRTYRDYLTALQHATNYAEVILPEARAAYELQLKSYRDDRIAWSDVLRTQRDYFALRAEYVRNLIAWREADVRIAGFLLHGGLTAPTGPAPPGHIDAVPKPR